MAKSRLNKTLLTSGTSDSLLFTARNTSDFPSARALLMKRLLRHQGSEVPSLKEAMAERFFALGRGWQVLDFSEIDWENIASIDAVTDVGLANLKTVCLHYIKANRERILTLDRIQKQFSKSLLEAESKPSDDVLSHVSSIDLQSNFVYKLISVFNSNDFESLVSTFRSGEKSNWVRRHFSNVIAHYAAGTPHDSQIDMFLSYILPFDNKKERQKDVIRHILRDDLSFEYTIAFKIYVGLSLHPYDLYKSLLNHFEIEFARDDRLSDYSYALFDALAGVVQNPETEALRRLYGGAPIDLVLTDKEISSRTVTPEIFPEPAAQFVKAFVSISDIDFNPSKTSDLSLFDQISSELKMLGRMRWSRYPDVEDFTAIMDHRRLWCFLDYGRALQSLMTSMYMVPREQKFRELRDLHWLACQLSCFTPFMVGSPRGEHLLQSAEYTTRESIHAGVSAALLTRKDATDRTWFSSLQWRLAECRKQGRVKEWLATARSSLPVVPSYLSGVDWSWIDDVIDRLRIVPFRETPDGPYVLMLRDIEEGRRDTTTLRTAIEPRARGYTLTQFVEWLIGEYKQWSVAFVKFFLSPENIMLLGLAPNMLAALSGRIGALEQCARTFKFTDLLSEAQLTQERQSLTSALMLLNVNDNQFDIPWDLFRRDVSELISDHFRSYTSTRASLNAQYANNEQRTPYVKQFTNSRISNYQVKSTDFVVTGILFAVIDLFLDHPAYGIEAILSTRFRHDRLRREYVFMFDKIRETYIHGVVKQDLDTIVDLQSYTFLDYLDEWVSSRVQSVKPDTPKGMFDLTPTQTDLDSLLSAVQTLDHLDPFIDSVIIWLKTRLETQLIHARTLFISELTQTGVSLIEDGAQSIPQDNYINNTVSGQVTSAVVSTVRRRSNELLEWFKSPDETSRTRLTLSELVMAVLGRYEQYTSSDRLRIHLRDCEPAHHEIEADRVRFYFDMLNEVVQNALKHGGRERALIRIEPFDEVGQWGFTFSSLATAGVASTEVIEGHPYKSLSEELFREGNSGLKKVAAIAASIVGEEVRVTAVRRLHAFHLSVPLGVSEVRAKAPSRVLVIEDSDIKFEAITTCLQEALATVEVQRAATMTEAEHLIDEEEWHLIVLDISMDIAPSISGPKARGQANIGGLGIAQKMFLLGKETPTIVVTAFDSFTAGSSNGGTSETVDFKEVSRRARDYLKSSLSCCLQYNSHNWRNEMIKAVKEVISQ